MKDGVILEVQVHEGLLQMTCAKLVYGSKASAATMRTISTHAQNGGVLPGGSCATDSALNTWSKPRARGITNCRAQHICALS